MGPSADGVVKWLGAETLGGVFPGPSGHRQVGNYCCCDDAKVAKIHAARGKLTWAASGLHQWVGPVGCAAGWQGGGGLTGVLLVLNLRCTERSLQGV